LRAALTPSVAHMPFMAIIAALIVLTAGFTWAALVRFRMRALG
jgi:hypothetical protein